MNWKLGKIVVGRVFGRWLRLNINFFLDGAYTLICVFMLFNIDFHGYVSGGLEGGSLENRFGLEILRFGRLRVLLSL